MKPAIVVTGAGGFIGRAVLPRLADAFSEGTVMGLDLRPRPPSWRGEWLEGSLERLREVTGPFVAVHLAWNLRRGDPAAQAASLADFHAMMRIPGLAALVGMVLNIKPLLKGDMEGKIVSFAKIRGRKKAIIGLAEQYDKFGQNADQQTIGIAHADCQEDVDYLISLLKQGGVDEESVKQLNRVLQRIHK